MDIYTEHSCIGKGTVLAMAGKVLRFTLVFIANRIAGEVGDPAASQLFERRTLGMRRVQPPSLESMLYCSGNTRPWPCQGLEAKKIKKN